MSRYMILGGFLGAGKTTLMMAFAHHLTELGISPAIVVNDLGSRNLVDGRLTRAGGFRTEEITGDCICYQTAHLVETLRRLRDEENAEVIFSDIPGCGIGAMDHVYHRLQADYPGEFDLCPFVAVADPERLQVILPEPADIHLPGEMDYLFDAQMREAEVILLNKIDLLTEQETERYLTFLRERYPLAAVFGVSAREKRGTADALEYLLTHSSALPVRDIGYGSPAFLAAEEKMSWYNRQFFVKGEAFEAEPFLIQFLEGVRAGLRAADRNVPHLKVMAETEGGGLWKASLTGVDVPVQWDRRGETCSSSLKVIVNARAVCESSRLDELMDFALREAVRHFGLQLHIFFTECFGMMDEGRL